MEDVKAITRLKQGDLLGLEILITRYQAKAVHTAYLILFDRSLAEDVVQAAFIKIAKQIHQFDVKRPFGPWFFRIVINDSLKAIRKQKREVSIQDHLDEPTKELAKWLIDPKPHPELYLEQKEYRQIVLNAIKSLPPDQRAVIVMNYFLDMPMADMSRELNRPLSTIKWWLRDARKRLRVLLNSLQDN